MLPKHILGHAAVVLGLVVSLSAPAVAQPKVFDGTYVAVGVSLFTQSASTSFTGLDEGTPFSASSKTTKTDVGGGVIVGYGKQLLARYYVGGELDFGVNNSSHQASSTFGSATTTYSRLTVSPMLRLGYLLRDDLMLFGRWLRFRQHPAFEFRH